MNTTWIVCWAPIDFRGRGRVDVVVEAHSNAETGYFEFIFRS